MPFSLIPLFFFVYFNNCLPNWLVPSSFPLSVSVLYVTFKTLFKHNSFQKQFVGSSTAKQTHFNSNWKESLSDD
jgi:hypothetical protein